MSSVTIDLPQPPSNFKSSVDIHGQHAKGTAACEFILFNKTTCLSRAQLIWFGGKESFTYPITKELIMTGKLSFNRVKQKFPAPIFDSLPAFSGVQTVIGRRSQKDILKIQSGQFLFSYSEIRGVGDQRVEIQKTAEYLYIKDWVGVIHISDKLKIYTIPTSPLSHELGMTNDNYPRLLHGLFVTRVPSKIPPKKLLPDSITIAPAIHSEMRSNEGETVASSSSNAAEVSRKKRKVSFAPSPLSSEDSFSRSSSPSKESSPSRRSVRLSRLRDNSEEVMSSKASLVIPKAIITKALATSEAAKKLRELLDTRVTRSKVAAASASQEVNSDDESVSSTVSSIASNSSISAGIGDSKRRPGRPPGAKNKKKKEFDSDLATQPAQSSVIIEETLESEAKIAMDFLSKHTAELSSGKKRRRRRPVEVKEGKAQDCNIVLYEALESACHALTCVEVESQSSSVDFVPKIEAIDEDNNSERKAESGPTTSSDDYVSAVAGELVQSTDLKTERNTSGDDAGVDILCPSSEFICEDSLLVQQILADDGPEIEVEEISQGYEMGLEQFTVIEGKAGQYTAPPKKMSLADYKRRRSTVEETVRPASKLEARSITASAVEQVLESNQILSQVESSQGEVSQDSTTGLGLLKHRSKESVLNVATAGNSIVTQDGRDTLNREKVPSDEVLGLSSEDMEISLESSPTLGDSQANVKIVSPIRPLTAPIKSLASPHKTESSVSPKKSKLLEATSQPAADTQRMVKSKGDRAVPVRSGDSSVQSVNRMEHESVTCTELGVPGGQSETLPDAPTKSLVSSVKVSAEDLAANSASEVNLLARTNVQQDTISDEPGSTVIDQTERLAVGDSPLSQKKAPEEVTIKGERIDAEMLQKVTQTSGASAQEPLNESNKMSPSKDMSIETQPISVDSTLLTSKHIGMNSSDMKKEVSPGKKDKTVLSASVEVSTEGNAETPGDISVGVTGPIEVSAVASVATTSAAVVEMVMSDPVVPNSVFSIPIRQRMPVPISPHVLNVPPPYYHNPVNRWILPPPGPPVPPPPPMHVPPPPPPGVYGPSEPPPGPGVFTSPNPLRPPLPAPLPTQHGPWNNFGNLFSNLPGSTQQHFFDSVMDMHRQVQTPECATSSAADSPCRSPPSQGFRLSRSRSRSQGRSRSRSRSVSSRSSSRSSGRSTQSDRSREHHEMVQKTELLTKIYQDLEAMRTDVCDVSKQDVGIQCSPHTRNFKCQHGSSFKLVTHSTQTPRRAKQCDIGVQAVFVAQVCNKGLQIDGPRKRNTSTMTTQVNVGDSSSQTSEMEAIDSKKSIDELVGLLEDPKWTQVRSIIQDFLARIEDKKESDSENDSTSEHSDESGSSSDEGMVDDNAKEDLVPSPVISGASNISEGDLSDITPTGSESGTPPPSHTRENVEFFSMPCSDKEVNTGNQTSSCSRVSVESEMEDGQRRMLPRRSLTSKFTQGQASPTSESSLPPLSPPPPPPPPLPAQLEKLHASQTLQSSQQTLECCTSVCQETVEELKSGNSVTPSSPTISLLSASRLSSVKKNTIQVNDSVRASLLSCKDKSLNSPNKVANKTRNVPEISKHDSTTMDYIPLFSDDTPYSCNDTFCVSDSEDYMLTSALSAEETTDKRQEDAGSEECYGPDENTSFVKSRTTNTKKQLSGVQKGSKADCHSPQNTNRLSRRRGNNSASPSRSSDKFQSRSRPRSRSKSKKRRPRDWSYSRRRRMDYSRSVSRERSCSRRRYYNRSRSSSNESCSSMRSWRSRGRMFSRNRYRSESPLYGFTTKTKPAIDIVLSKSSKKISSAAKSKPLNLGPVVKKPTLTAAELLAKKRERESLNLRKGTKENNNQRNTRSTSVPNSPLDIDQMMENFKIHMAKRSSKSPTPTFPDNYHQYTTHCSYPCVMPPVSDPILVQSSVQPLAVPSLATQAPPHSFGEPYHSEAVQVLSEAQLSDSMQPSTLSCQLNTLTETTNEGTLEVLENKSLGDTPKADHAHLNTNETASKCSESAEVHKLHSSKDGSIIEFSEEPATEDGQLCDTIMQDGIISQVKKSELQNVDAVIPKCKTVVNKDAWSHGDSELSLKADKLAWSEADTSKKTFKIKIVRCSTSSNRPKEDSSGVEKPDESIKTLDEMSPIQKLDKQELKLPMKLPQSPTMEEDNSSDLSNSPLQLGDKSNTLLQISFNSELSSTPELQPPNKQLKDAEESHLQEKPDMPGSNAEVSEELIESIAADSHEFSETERSTGEMEKQPNDSNSDDCKSTLVLSDNVETDNEAEPVQVVDEVHQSVHESSKDLTGKLLEDDPIAVSTTVTPVNENFVVDASSTIHEISSDSNSYGHRSSCTIVETVSDQESGSHLFPFSESPFAPKPSVSVKTPVARRKSLEEVLKWLSVDHATSPKKLLLSGIQSGIKSNFIWSQSTSPTHRETPKISHTSLVSSHHHNKEKSQQVRTNSLVVSIPIQIRNDSICVIPSAKRPCLRTRHTRSRSTYSGDDGAMIVSFPLDKIALSVNSSSFCFAANAHGQNSVAHNTSKPTHSSVSAQAASCAPIITSTRFHIIECRESVEVCESPPGEDFVKSPPLLPNLKLSMTPSNTSDEMQSTSPTIPNAVTKHPVNKIKPDSSLRSSGSKNDPKIKFSFHWGTTCNQFSSDVPGSANQGDAQFDEPLEPLSPSSIINTAKAYLSECYESPESDSSKSIDQTGNVDKVKSVSQHQPILPCTSSEKSVQRKRSLKTKSHNRSKYLSCNNEDSGIGTGASCSPEDGAKKSAASEVKSQYHGNDDLRKTLFNDKPSPYSTVCTVVSTSNSVCAKSKSQASAPIKDQPVSLSKSQASGAAQKKPLLSGVSKNTIPSNPVNICSTNGNVKPVINHCKTDTARKDCHHSSLTKSPENPCIVSRPPSSTSGSVVSAAAMKCPSSIALKKSSQIVKKSSPVTVHCVAPDKDSSNPSISAKSSSVVPERLSVSPSSTSSGTTTSVATTTSSGISGTGRIKLVLLKKLSSAGKQGRKEKTSTVPQKTTVSSTSTASGATKSTISGQLLNIPNKIDSKSPQPNMKLGKSDANGSDSSNSSKLTVSSEKSTILPTPKSLQTNVKHDKSDADGKDSKNSSKLTVSSEKSTIVPKLKSLQTNVKHDKSDADGKDSKNCSKSTVPSEMSAVTPTRPTPSSSSSKSGATKSNASATKVNSTAKVDIDKKLTSGPKPGIADTVNPNISSSIISPDKSGKESKGASPSSGSSKPLSSNTSLSITADATTKVPPAGGCGQSGTAEKGSNPSSSNKLLIEDTTSPSDIRSAKSSDELPIKPLLETASNKTQLKTFERLPFENTMSSLSKPWEWDKPSSISSKPTGSLSRQAKSESCSVGDASVSGVTAKSLAGKQGEITSPEIKPASWKNNAYITSPLKTSKHQDNALHSSYRDRCGGYANYQNRYSASPYISPPHQYFRNPYAYSQRTVTVDYGHGSSSSGNYSANYGRGSSSSGNYSSQQYSSSTGKNSNKPLLTSPPHAIPIRNPRWFPRP